MKPIHIFHRKSPDRIGLIDEVRGFAILCMVVYHAFYDLIVLFGVDIPFFYSPLMNGIRDAFAGLFIFISGAACRFSHSNLRRGVICFGFGMVLTVVTAIFMPDELIVFGILHMLGVAMILFPLCKPILDRLPLWLSAALLMLLAVFTWNLSHGTVGIPGLWNLSVPDGPYRLGWLFWLGFPGDLFSSADYFPLLPWLFIFLLGSLFGKLLVEKKLPGFFYRTHCRPLAFVGRNTLVIYVLHQPVVYLLIWLIAQLCGK